MNRVGAGASQKLDYLLFLKAFTDEKREKRIPDQTVTERLLSSKK